MKAFFSAFVFIIFFSSCLKESNFRTITIPANQEIIFSKPDSDGKKSIMIPVNHGTLSIAPWRLGGYICYLRLAFPDKDIIITYIAYQNDDKMVFEPRWVDLKK